MAKFTIKITALIVLVGVLQVTVVPRFWRMKDVKRFDSCLKHNPDVVYFCDSTNAWIDGGDTNKQSIAGMLDERLADADVGIIERGAYHAEIYEAFVDLIIRRGLQPKAVIIPINLRSFSPEWDLRPAYQFAKSKRQIRNADDTFALGMGAISRTLQLVGSAPISQHEFKKMPVNCGNEVVGIVQQFDNPTYETVTEQRTRNKFIYHYMYPLEKNHRKLVALRNIAAKARRANLNVVFYITPIDVETGERYLKGKFREHVDGNAATIMRSLAEHQPPVLNLAFSLPPDGFSWHDYPNEHMRETGRRLVANQLAGVFSESLGFDVSPQADQREEYIPHNKRDESRNTAQRSKASNAR